MAQGTRGYILPKLTRRVCTFCGDEAGPRGMLLEGRMFCLPCQPYALAAFAQPQYAEANKAIALRLAARR